ncbi:MAG: hypothetical protein HY820_11635 [Acidobacteria bacterium]|nr:hypothetical protein [Acidobacteriota bacterium]
MIQIPSEQAEALRAKAALEGLTLEAWLRKLAGMDMCKKRYQLADLVAQCDLTAPLSAEDQAWLDAPAIGREAL